MTLSRNIRQFRKDNGITQDEMAEKLHMSQPTYHRFEHQDATCAKRILKIAQAMDTTPETLLNYHLAQPERTEPELTELEKKALAEKDALIQKLSEEIRLLHQKILDIETPAHPNHPKQKEG